jgi:tetratricopeptide (TPR) repeat protein
LGEAEGLKFITMEFIEGRDLKSLLGQEGKLSPDRAVEIIQQVCLALEAAHAEGVVHRDLKPQNIMLDQQGRASVMDFGIARSLEFGGMTQTGAVMGTPEYMSPEQVRGEHVDTRSDLFTLGIIFQELLTGTLPYRAETAMASMFKRTKERAIPVRELNPAVPQILSDIVGKCLEIEPENRFQSARELYDALDAWKKGASASFGASTLGRVRRAFRHRAVKGSAAAVAAVGVLLLVAMIAYRLKKPSNPTTAHAPVSVLVADFANYTGDPIFDGTLEPMLNTALEGASFVNAYSRGDARTLAQKLPHPTDKLDEQSARLVAVGQGLAAVVTGSLSLRGDNYKLSVEALDARTGKTIASAEVSASNKDQLLLDLPKLAAPIRKALGDTTPESVQLNAAGGAFQVASLEAAHQYGIAMEQQFAGKMQDALQSFSKAAELDPNFARAYAGMSAVSQNLGNQQDGEKYIKLAIEHVDRMTERERYRIRGLYYLDTEDFEKCIEEYGELLKQYPADNIGHNNISICYIALNNIPKAAEELQRGLDILPNNQFARANLAMYRAYDADFPAAEREARKVLEANPSYAQAYVALASAQFGQGQLADAVKTYGQLEKVSSLGQSLAAQGLADIADYEGRFADAAQLLQQAAARDLQDGRLDSGAADLAALGYIQLLQKQKAAALVALEKALAKSKASSTRFLAARTYILADETDKARALATELGSESGAEAQADAKLIQGEIALYEKDPRKAIELFNDANKLLATWIGWFDLGRAYLEAGLYVEADSELDHCTKRRGETLNLFLVPAYGYLPDVYYYQGLVREGLKSPGAADSYRTYLSIRGKAGEDPRLPEVRHRLGQ